MKDSKAIEIASRFESYLTSEMTPERLKSILENFFYDVSVIAITGHEQGEFPYDLRDGMCHLKNLIQIFDINKEFVK